jgi:hypothetical protein
MVELFCIGCVKEYKNKNTIYNILYMTTKKTEFLRGFNTLLESMFKDIISIFPDNKEIKIAQLKYDSIRKMNPSLIIKIWFSYIYTPYASIIDTGDIEFFYNKDYSEDLKHITGSKDIIVMIDNVRTPIKSMNEENKTKMTKYIKNLSSISVLYSKC